MNTLSLKSLGKIRKSSLDIKNILNILKKRLNVPNNVTTKVKHETYLLAKDYKRTLLER